MPDGFSFDNYLPNTKYPTNCNKRDQRWEPMNVMDTRTFGNKKDLALCTCNLQIQVSQARVGG